MTRDAVGPLAYKKREPPFGWSVDGIFLAGDVAVKRSVSTNALTQVGLDCLAKISENMIDNLLVILGHRCPLRIAWFSGGRKGRGLLVARIKPGIKGSGRTTEYFVILLAVFVPKHMGYLKTAAVL